MARDDRDVRAIADFLGDLLTDGAKNLAGERELAKEAFRETHGLKNRLVPCMGVFVDHRTRGGVAILLGFQSGQAVVEIIGELEEARSLLELAGFQIVIELIDRIEGLEGNAGFLKEFLFGEDLLDFLAPRLAGSVAVRIGVAKFLAVFIEEDVVDAPGVDADARRGFAELFGFLEGDDDLLEKAVDVPIEFVIARALRVIGKTVDFLHVELPSLLAGENRPAAGSADVDREIGNHNLISR